jgi:hypothetical protein
MYILTLQGIGLLMIADLIKRTLIMVMIYMTFDIDKEVMGENIANSAIPLAESINKEEGIISKVWIHNLEKGKRGGVYIFDTLENAKAYASMHALRVANIGGTNIEFAFFDINVPLSKINHGIKI